MDRIFERLADGFTGFDWWMILLWSLVTALIMRRSSQLVGAVTFAFIMDAISPFFWRWATGSPPDFAFDLMLARLDDRGGLVVLARIAIYFAAIFGLFVLKRRNWR